MSGLEEGTETTGWGISQTWKGVAGEKEAETNWVFWQEEPRAVHLQDQLRAEKENELVDLNGTSQEMGPQLKDASP